MRGKRGGIPIRSHNYRITPADAGKTAGERLCLYVRWDHPRGCGENARKVAEISGYGGSPPRMRGKLCVAIHSHHEIGITPADAGKTQRERIQGDLFEDHPRGCGENLTDGRQTTHIWGSPPRMRGKLTFDSRKRYDLRITPADAGKTDYTSTLSAGVQDHPRGCGENFACGVGGDVIKGSPPRMRGKRLSGFAQSPSRRITPADAGKT